MFRIKTVHKIAIIIVLICPCLITAPLWAQVVNIQKPPLSKKGVPGFEGVLSELIEINKVKGINTALQFARTRKIPIINKRIRLIVESKGSVKDIKIPGAIVEATHGNLAQILVSLKDVAAINALPSINFVRLPLLPIPHVESEGLTDIGAYEWHNANYKGNGIKVAVLDCEGFAGYQNLIGNELPTADKLVVQSFRADVNIETGYHGLACAEIVHDIAPDATLYLVNYNTELELDDAVDWLISEQVDAITHSCGWILNGPYDGTGSICDATNRAYNAGIIWSNSTGNQALRHWEGIFTDTDGDGIHELAQSPIDETIALSAGVGSYIVVGLSWDDWGPNWPNEAGSVNDYDLYLYRGGHRNLSLVASSQTTQNGTQPPTEGIIYYVTQPGIYHIVIKNFNANGSHHLEVYSFNHNLQHIVSDSSLCIPADAGGAIAIGAAYWSDKVLEPFSSWGPPNMPGGGGRDYSIIKPDILAPDGVSSATYNPFYGSSASSPHVAGVAALLLSCPSYSCFTPDAIREVLINNATNYNYGANLPDFKHGYGFLTMPALPLTCTDGDNDGYNAECDACGPIDCDDTDDAINPEAIEICNGIDDNCNGQIDEGLTLYTYYLDADTDGYGNPGNTTQACSAPAGYVSDSTDCDDTDDAVNPAAAEVCNGIDDDCNGQIDEGCSVCTDVDGDGWCVEDGDCDDNNRQVYPGHTDSKGRWGRDGLDNDCNGIIDG